MLNAYVEPGAMAGFERTGRWPDGTRIVKEFSTIQVGDGCDATTHVCSTRFGRGIFQAGYIGLGMMVKDARRSADAPGHWAYVSFGHKPPPYDSTSPMRPRAKGSQRPSARHATSPSPRTPTT